MLSRSMTSARWKRKPSLLALVKNGCATSRSLLFWSLTTARLSKAGRCMSFVAKLVFNFAFLQKKKVGRMQLWNQLSKTSSSQHQQSRLTLLDCLHGSHFFWPVQLSTPLSIPKGSLLSNGAMEGTTSWRMKTCEPSRMFKSPMTPCPMRPWWELDKMLKRQLVRLEPCMSWASWRTPRLDNLCEPFTPLSWWRFGEKHFLLNFIKDDVVVAKSLAVPIGFVQVVWCSMKPCHTSPLMIIGDIWYVLSLATSWWGAVFTRSDRCQPLNKLRLSWPTRMIQHSEDPLPTCCPQDLMKISLIKFLAKTNVKIQNSQTYQILPLSWNQNSGSTARPHLSLRTWRPLMNFINGVLLHNSNMHLKWMNTMMMKCMSQNRHLMPNHLILLLYMNHLLLPTNSQRRSRRWKSSPMWRQSLKMVFIELLVNTKCYGSIKQLLRKTTNGTVSKQC